MRSLPSLGHESLLKRRMSIEPRDYLRHILVEADYLLASQQGLSFETFMADETLQRAFVRSLEIIGEATKKVPQEFRSQHPDIDWRAMAGMRRQAVPSLTPRAVLDTRHTLASSGRT